MFRPLFIFLFISCSLFAVECDHPLSLSECVDIALQNRPSTRQAWWNANRAAAALGSAKSAYYPKLDLDAFATNGRDFKFLNGPDTNYTIVGADLILSMMLYDFGETRASVKGAKMALRAANWQTDWVVQKVMVEVLDNAYSVVHAQEGIAAARFSLEDAERMLNLAEELHKAGLTPVSDLYVARAGYARMKMDLKEQQAALAIQKGKLAVSLGMDSDCDIQLMPIEKPQKLQTEMIADLLRLARCQRADLLAKRAELSEALANETKIRSSYSPKLSFLGKGGADHAVHNKANAMHYAVTLDLAIPLFTGFDAMYQKRMAYANTQVSREELAQLELDISLEVLTHSRLLEAFQEMMCDVEVELENSLKAYQGMLEIYRAGKERISAVSEAQRQLAAARVHYSDIQTRWLISSAKLAYATGTLGNMCQNDLTQRHRDTEK